MEGVGPAAWRWFGWRWSWIGFAVLKGGDAGVDSRDCDVFDNDRNAGHA